MEKFRFLVDNEIRPFIAIFAVWVFAAIGKNLLKDEPLNWRVLIGEIILAAVGSIVMYSFGMYQGMDAWQMIFIGSLAGLGGVRLIEQVIRIFKFVSSVKIK